ncbi:type VII secretion integral membrane protein EccD [Streptomyces specialis]|uniref:type VII secretion integral membrane protein EccD n=1 Tax=Streptomyces specialis TaxID=498367 RepID=UPI00073E522A|nr:type VII secretion integral membrane protein EccD [Streptomyces specialis]
MVSRVTLVGHRRRVDLVLPSDEPIGELLPDVLRLLGERAAGVPASRWLITPGGEVLGQDETLSSAGVADGAVLRLVRQEETPAAPVVHDVTDVAADDLDARGWRWDHRTRMWTAGAATLTLGLVAAAQARERLGADDAGGWLLGVAGAVAVLGALVAAVLGGRRLGAVLILLGGALGVFGAWTATEDERPAAVGLAVVVTLTLLGLCTAAGRGALVGAAALALAVGGWEACAALVSETYESGVLLGVASVLALGFLPRVALSAAGLAALDDRRSGGASVSRYRVDSALAATHRGLALATVVTAGSAAVAGWLAVQEADAWRVAVTALLAVVLLSRARAFPLAVEVVALLAAGTVLVVRLLLLWADRPGGSAAGPLIALSVLAVLPLALFVVRPPDHVRVRLRRLANLAESVGVVALIPVAVGAFGVYGRLLDTF